MQKEYIEKQKVIELINKFDSFISSITRTTTDEHIAIYEHWIDCNYDIKELPTVTGQEVAEEIKKQDTVEFAEKLEEKIIFLLIILKY